jgi:hypothetical protein
MPFDFAQGKQERLCHERKESAWRDDPRWTVGYLW